MGSVIEPVGAAVCLFFLFTASLPALGAQERTRSSERIVFADGTEIEVQHYDLRGEIIVFETMEGELRSMSRDYVDLGATERMNSASRDRGSTPEPASPVVPAPSSASGVAIIDGPPPPQPPDMVARDELGRVTLRAVRLPEPLVLDGRLDDPVYGEVPAVSGFIQQEPREGQVATEQTDVWVFFDDDNVYVSARCWDSHPERIVVSELRRGNVGISRGDNLTVVLDTFYDRRNGFFFQTNPLGGVYDSLVTDERNENIDWDTVWYTHSARFEQGWSVEMALPFKSLRYRGGRDQVWGINVRRIVQWKNEMSYLNPAPAAYGRSAIMKFSSAATLVGIEPPTQSINLELKPYGIAKSITDTVASPPTSNDLTADFGFDVKYGLTRGLIADFTYNTDFAQVEADEAQVNLTRFNLFFPEKRQFFLEGSDIFRFGGAGPRFSGLTPVGDAPIVFFSRRIGLADGRPIPISVGGRVTGREGPYTIGALSIQTDADPILGAAATNFTVARLKRNIMSRSSIGIIATNRSPTPAGSGSNQVFGVDGAFAFFSNMFIDTYYARTRTPDREGNAESYRAQVVNNGDRYGFQYDHLVVGRDFNPEIGFVRRRDFRRHFGKVQFTPRPAASNVVRKYRYEAGFDHVTNETTGVVESRAAMLTFGIDFQSSDRWFVDYTRSYEFLAEPFEVSAGVILPIGGYDFQDVRATYQLGQQHPLSGNVSFLKGSFYSGDRTEASYGGRLRVTNDFALEPSVAINWIDLPEGSFTTQLFRLRAIFTMSPRMFIESLTQYNSSVDVLGTNIRFRWEYQPGSDLYIAYNEGRDTGLDSFAVLNDRVLAIKFTRLFRF
jgi:hypothetical protein